MNSSIKQGGLQDIHRQIMWNRLLAVVEEQAQTLIRTAFSTIVRESGDLSAGVFDTQGRMLAQAVTGTPGHVNSMAESVGHFLKAFPIDTMKDGDVYCTNDPWMGTGHLNDLVVVTPTFYQGRLVALFACTSHLMDIGGLGQVPDTTDVFMEGLYVPFLRLFDRGQLNETLMAMFKANTRTPIDTEGDVYSLVNCNAIGSRRLCDMMQEFGLTDLDTLGQHILQSSRQAVLDAVRALPKGSWSYTMTVDGYRAPITLNATTTISEDGVKVDFAGTSPSVRNGINCPMAYTKAYAIFGLSCAIAPRIPNNAGSLSVFEVVAPPGSVLNAIKPTPVSTRHIIGQMLPDVVFGCLHQMMPDRIPAEGTSCLYLMTFRGQEGGSNGAFACTIVTNGGVGARPGKDGLSATAFPSGVKGTPVEIVENITPLLFWKKELREGSGGQGQWRGGDGVAIEVENRSRLPVEFLATLDRIQFPPRGRDGGQPGASGYVGIRDSDRAMAGKGIQVIAPGEVLKINTPGGGGLGSVADFKSVGSS